MAKELCISSTPHETRLAIIEDDQLTEIYYERENEYTLAGSIYKGRVTRVLPGMQSAFVDVGLERDAFLYVTDFLEEQGETADFEKPRSEGQGGRGRSESRQEGRPDGRGDGRQARLSREAAGGDNSRIQVEPTGQVDEAIESDSGRVEAVSPRTAQGGESSIAPTAQPGQDEFDQGTRKWRGRRGRRRGFRGGQREGGGIASSPQLQGPGAGASSGQAIDQSGLAEDYHDEPEAPFEAVAGMPVSSTAEAAVPRESFSSTREHGRQARDTGREGSRERGSRDDAPAGAGKPTFLPGESLSKYGHTPAAAATLEPSSAPRAIAKSTPPVTSRPSTIVEVLPGWDGISAALPGESLSRYKNRPATGTERTQGAPPAETGAAEPKVSEDKPTKPSFAEPAPDQLSFSAAENAGQFSGHFEDRTAAGVPDQAEIENAEAGQKIPESSIPNQQGATESHAAPMEILHAVQTPHGVTFEDVSSSFHEDQRQAGSQPGQPPALAPLPESAPAEVAHHDGAQQESAPLQESAAGTEAVTVQPVPLHQEEEETGSAVGAPEEQEFEPENASASYRVNPNPSTLRLGSSSVADVETDTSGSEETSPEHMDFDAEHLPESLGAPLISTATLGEHGGFDPAAPLPEVEQARTLSEHAPDGDIAQQHSVQTHPDIEDWQSEPHATAAAGTAAPGTLVEPLHAFAPGLGELEEEVIDEEEFDFTPVHHAADDHDLEEIEEETTDHTMVGSQLGDLVRDKHIQQRLHEPDGHETDEEFDESEEENLDAPGELSEADEAHARAESGAGGFTEEDFFNGSSAEVHEATTQDAPAPRRDDGRRDGRSGDGRNNQRGGRRSNGQRGRSGGGGGGHRHSSQTSDMPIISDLLKQGQEVLVQIAKEPIAKKGARITSHIALPGRFLVFMPTVNHVGVSRKISSDEERMRLKRVLSSEKGTAPGGFIVRTAADGASEEELRADLRFLISLWTEIKQRSDTGKSPALIYHDLNLVERILRDQVSDNFSTIWVDSETEYERIVRFLNRFEPTLVRRVKLYTKETPLFEQFGIQEEISKALKSKVWLKSGGSIVINQTEALVAIDINTGKYVGKTARLEDTIVKTNLDAIPEIVRQIRLRDLGGIIIIDFIDMDERKNRNRVMQALEEALKADRAPSKVLQFNDFGLVAITRKRVKQSLERTLSTQCEICAGTGMVKSPITVCNEIYTELRKMQKHFDRGDVLLRVHPEIVKALKANNGKWLGELEEMIGRTIIVKSDPALHPEQFDIH